MSGRGSGSRGIGALAAAMVLVLAGCASAGAGGGEADPGSTSGAPPALSAEIVQGRGDVRDGVVAIVVTNDSDEEVVVDHAEYRSSALVEPLVGGDDSTIPAGASRALRGTLPQPTCATGPIVDEVVVVLADGTEVRLDPGDPYDQIPTLTDAPCTRLAVERVVDVAWLPIAVPDPALGADATVSLRLTPTGDGALEVRSVEPTVLLALVDAAGQRTTEVPLDVTIEPDGGAQTIAFAVRPGRCDAHAIAEDKQGTIFVFQVVLDGVERTLQLPSDDATRDALLAYVAASCGLG
ncbi:hypothetical protein [Agrococcus sp. SGAir0287]|uniref:hypothetical protein n=1 Tax=Agrococcus sp. SGAir0287 TaxID=2070347 RepID=UPI0010CD36A8|nr:hypothetical protein [Agrococcus sp. SGAir0287]QCR18744.1 hypothetical protein C1N71_04165 [Agrococcus sp. SGAir0287]